MHVRQVDRSHPHYFIFNLCHELLFKVHSGIFHEGGSISEIRVLLSFTRIGILVSDEIMVSLHRLGDVIMRKIKLILRILVERNLISS